MKTVNEKVEQLINESKYNEACDWVAKEFRIELEVKLLKYDKHFQDDTEKRDIYKITLKRGSRKYTFKFGQSVFHSGKYIGHKNLCLNKLGKYLFTEEEVKKMPSFYKSPAHHDIKLNKNFEEPKLYNVITCLQKYDIGTFEDFCGEFGYDEDSLKAERTYNAVRDEYQNICALFSDDELEVLNSIS